MIWTWVYHCGNMAPIKEECIDAGEGVGISGDLDVEDDEWNLRSHFVCVYIHTLLA